ncbi:MAG: autotransporter outer membrane beta-barrel domain-containing protein [Rhizobiales bacterium]|nr:autotransporter outer membrane beta-barrel domain-containing protein [Hyphomicrobiales bacterium]
MTACRILIMLAAIHLAISGQALAQSPPTNQPDCGASSPNLYSSGLESACKRALIGRQLLIHNADALARVVAASFHIGPSLIEPTGLENISAEEAAARLAGGSSFLISPAADVAAVAATPKWNAWIDGKYTWNDNSPENFDLDGPLWNGLAGFDYKLTDKITLGLIGSYESSDLDGIGTDLKSEGWGVGPYIGIVLTNNIVFSANALGSLVDTRQTGLHFDSERIQAAAALNGYWYHGTWRFTPGLSVSWSQEWMEETSNAAPDQDIETALLTPSVQIGDTLRLSETATVEPWAGTAFDWTFVNRIEQAGSPTIDDPNVDLRVQAGLNFGFGSNMQLSLTGEAGGLLLEKVDTYSGEANLAVQF